MLDRLRLSGGVHCFLVKKSVPKRLIEDCLKKAETEAVGHTTWIVRQAFNYGGKQQHMSCTLFRTEKLPSFLNNGTERDIKYCYAVILEMDGYVLVSKSGARDFSNLLEGHAKRVDGQVLMGAFLEKGSDIEKFTAEAIDAARAKVRKQTLEGKQLQDNVSTIGSSNKVLNNLQHKTNDKLISVVGNTGRYNFRGEKGTVDDFIQQNLIATQKFSAPIPQNEFLNNFATILKFSDHVASLKPREMLINTSDILDFAYSKDNPAPRLVYKKDGAKRYLPISVQHYMEKIGDLLEIKEDITLSHTFFLIENSIDKSLTLEHNANRYFLQSQKFEHMYLEFDSTDEVSIQALINQEQWFNLTFDVPQMHYAAGSLCRDNKLLGNIPGFLQMFVPDPALARITSEKGKPGKNAIKFPANTIFDYIESRFKAGVDHLILEDLGYEISDYIGIKKLLSVQLFHGKAADKTLSASAFQEVVGQALKNLNFFTQLDVIPAKAKTWNKLYSSTKINRIRTADKKNVEKDVMATLQATNVDKEVFLVVNFLSFAALRTELNKLKAEKPTKKATLPLLWLLSSLRTSCLERNVKVHIYCRP